MNIKEYIEKDQSIKEKYDYYKSLGYGEKASSILSIFTYGRRQDCLFFASFEGKNILDKVYDFIAESDWKTPNNVVGQYMKNLSLERIDYINKVMFKSDDDSPFMGAAMPGGALGMGMANAQMTGGAMGMAAFVQANAQGMAAPSAPMHAAASVMASAACAPMGGMMGMPNPMASQMMMKMPEMPFAGFAPTASYENIEEKDAQSVLTAPTSTFRMTTSTASVGVLLNQVRNNWKISMSEVRIEELLNYFDYDNGEWPKENRKQFKIDTEIFDKAEGRKILYINVQADNTPKEKQNVVLLLDTSGSMSSNREVTQEAIATIISKLNEGDVLSLVTYSTNDNTVFTNHVIKDIKDKEDLMGILLTIEINGCTNGSAGIETAYSLGEKTYKDGWSNQVMLITDGDLNFGINSKDGLKKLIEEKKKTGMFLSVIGTGLSNYKDDKLEVLAKNGNGTYCTVNELDDVKESINKRYVSLTNIVAKDVKAQVEFNPKYVKKYRLLGYENRTLNHEDFKNDEVISEPYGAGGQGVALYELYMGDATEDPSEELKYQKLQSNDYKEIGTVSVRFKAPLSDESEEISEIIPDEPATGNNVKAAYLLYCLSEKLRGSNKLDTDDFKFLASQLNDDNYKELIKGKDDVFAKLFESVKKEALKAPEKKVDPNIMAGPMFDDRAYNPNQPMTGFMGINMMNNMMNPARGLADPDNKPPVNMPEVTGGWDCPNCGHKANTGKFCVECGSWRPELDPANNATQPSQAPTTQTSTEQAPVSSEEWTCTMCGQVNTTKFCTNCGNPRPKA